MGIFSKKQQKKISRNPLKKAVAVGQRHSPTRPLIGAVLMLVSALMLIAVVAYTPAQDTFFPSLQVEQTTAMTARNPIGILGASVALVCLQLIGYAWVLLPSFGILAGVLCFAKKAYCLSVTKFLFMGLCLLSGAGLLGQVQLLAAHENTAFVPYGFGGQIGAFLSGKFLDPLAGNVGALLILAVLYVVSFVLVFIPNPAESFERWLLGIWQAIVQWWVNRRERRRAAREAKAIAKAQRKAALEAERERLEEEKRLAQEQARLEAEQAAARKKEEDEAIERSAEQQAQAARIAREAQQAAKAAQQRAQSATTFERFGQNDDGVSALTMQTPEPKAEKPKADLKKELAPTEPVFTKTPAKAADKSQGQGLKIIEQEKVEKAALKQPVRRGSYRFPPLDLLAPQASEDKFPQEDHEARMDAVVQKLAQFNLKVFPAEVQTGPIITRYEVQPAEGVRVSRIANLDKDLALGLKAMGVRILAPVPGKGTVGIEVPNTVARPVGLREIIESKAWSESKAEIPVVLGKDVTGRPIVQDLAKMPHALVAGGTGSGKSVCVNSIIASLMYHSTPEDIRFIMVDPKVVEMQVYNSLPHMLIPVVTDPHKVPGALKYLVKEMERRYRLFAKQNVRNLVGFNAKIEKNIEKQKQAEELDASMTAEERTAIAEATRQQDEDDELPKEKLPYIVLIVDELADLMMTAPGEIEPGIARLTAKARAAGIHLIVATQRPSVNVVTGVIKANLPCRIAFKVASNTDSRTILDSPGAEVLLGRGDMLFIPPGTSELVRAQGAFIGDEELNGLVDYLKEHNGPPEYASSVQEEIDKANAEDEDGSDADDGNDDLETRALRALREQQAAGKNLSISWLQRRLSLGYNRAARMFEDFEDRGLIRTNSEGKKELADDDFED